MTRIGLLSDTHAYWDEKYLEYFESCDEIWHAGDIGSVEVAEKLAAFRPLRAVYGNIDGQEIRKMFPQVNRFTVDGAEVLIKHIGGQVRPFGYRQFDGPSAETFHQRTLPYIKGEIRQNVGHAAHQSRSRRDVRFP